MPISVNFFSGQVNSYSGYSSGSYNRTLPTSNPDTQTVSTEAVLGLTKLLKAMDELEQNISFAKKKSTQLTQVISNADFGLYTGPPTATTLRSADDINNFYTSYNPTQPAWQGLSSAELTLSGIYDGSNGSGVIDFFVSSGGIREVGGAVIEVRLPNGGGTETVNTSTGDPATTVYTLSNGLGLSLGTGVLAANDTASASLNISTTETIRPDNAFNGAGDNSPNFENSHVVTDGEFEINGVLIPVLDTDSINSVLAKITASDAGVSAQLDLDTETVVLTQKSLGSAFDIILGNDTSGFFSATKLSGTVSTAGLDNQVDQALDQVPRFSNIQSGTVQINGTDTAVDVSTDSLNSVVSRLDGNTANVTASLIRASQRLSLSTTGETNSIALASGNTQFFPSIGIDNGNYELSLNNAISPASKKRSYRAANQIQKFQDELTETNRLLQQSSQSANTKLQTVFEEIVDDFNKRFGAAELRALGLELTDLEDGLFAYSDESRRQFTQSLQKNDKLEKILLGTSERDKGLIDTIRSTIVDFIKQNAPAGYSGKYIDQYA